MDKLYDNIVKQANELFTQYGIRSISIDDICKQMGISKKTFYLYFSQKEDLVDAILSQCEHQIGEHFKELTKGKNSIETLLVLIKEAKQISSSSPPAMYYDLQKYYPKTLAKHDNEKTERTRIAFYNNLQQGIAEGYYREGMDIEFISTFFTFQHKNIIEQLKEHSKRNTNKRLVDFFIDLITHFIVSEKGWEYLNDHNIAISSK